jgi:hypothetical protein
VGCKWINSILRELEEKKSFFETFPEGDFAERLIDVVYGLFEEVIEGLWSKFWMNENF